MGGCSRASRFLQGSDMQGTAIAIALNVLSQPLYAVNDERKHKQCVLFSHASMLM